MIVSFPTVSEAVIWGFQATIYTQTDTSTKQQTPDQSTQYNALLQEASTQNPDGIYRQLKPQLCPFLGVLTGTNTRISASLLGSMAILQKASKAFIEVIPLCLT